MAFGCPSLDHQLNGSGSTVVGVHRSCGEPLRQPASLCQHDNRRGSNSRPNPPAECFHLVPLSWSPALHANGYPRPTSRGQRRQSVTASVYSDDAELPGLLFFNVVVKPIGSIGFTEWVSNPASRVPTRSYS